MHREFVQLVVILSQKLLISRTMIKIPIAPIPWKDTVKEIANASCMATMPAKSLGTLAMIYAIDEL